jgi:hypothetical protein
MTAFRVCIVKKSWTNPKIDQSGIDNITSHLSRFEDIDGDNAFMIDRLQKLKNGDIPATDYDKRFYTHELEEYNRYKNKGVADGINDEDFITMHMQQVWRPIVSMKSLHHCIIQDNYGRVN